MFIIIYKVNNLLLNEMYNKRDELNTHNTEIPMNDSYGSHYNNMDSAELLCMDCLFLKRLVVLC